MASVRYALNHMAAPALKIDSFFALAKSLGIDSVEIRNDLSGNAILDGTKPAEIKAAAERHGVTTISINALQRFNEWNETRAAEAKISDMADKFEAASKANSTQSAQRFMQEGA